MSHPVFAGRGALTRRTFLKGITIAASLSAFGDIYLPGSITGYASSHFNGRIVWNRSIPSECHEKMTDFLEAGHNIVCVAFPPAGGNRWSIITDKTFFNRNVPDECHQKMLDYRNAGHKLQWLAYPPAGGNSWSLITDKTFFNRNIPNECHQKMLDYFNAGHKIRSVSFPPAGGNRWTVITDKTFFNRGVPDECHEKMLDMFNDGHKLLFVAYPKAGGNRWSISSEQGFFNRNVPDELHMIMSEIYTCHGPMRVVAFDGDGSGWSAVAHAKNTVIYQLPFEDDGGWAVSNGNWDDPNGGGHGGNPNGLQAFAWDFTHREGGTLRAARGGVVYDLVKTESKQNKDCTDLCVNGVGNYLVINHGDGTYGVYWHMKQNGIYVDVNDRVSRGDEIGACGNTGCSSTSHLHFDVRTGWDLNYSCSNLSESPSIRIYFEDKNHICWIPREGDTLASNNA